MNFASPKNVQMRVPIVDTWREAKLVDTSSSRINVETEAVRDLLIVMLGEISPIALAGRRYTVTDKEVDIFIAEVCAVLSSDVQQLKIIKQFVARSGPVRDRAHTLYRWACEALCRSPKPFKTPLVCGSNPDNLLQTAKEIRESRASFRETAGIASWEQVCTEKLGALATLTISAPVGNSEVYDPFAVIHKCVTDLAGEPSIFDMAALSQWIETETFNFVNTIVAKDTHEDLPGVVKAVRASRIVMIDDASAASNRVARDRV